MFLVSFLYDGKLLSQTYEIGCICGYEPVFIHAKSYIADDEYAMIGMINLDYRSLVHHFENGVWMYRCDSTNDLKTDIEEIIAKSIEGTHDMLRTGLVTRFVRSVVRIFAPML